MKIFQKPTNNLKTVEANNIKLVNDAAKKVNQLTRDYNELLDSFKADKKRLRAEAKKEETELKRQLAELENEVNILEERKKIALEPIDRQKKELLQATQDNEELIDELGEKLATLKEEEDLIQEKRTELEKLYTKAQARIDEAEVMRESLEDDRKAFKGYKEQEETNIAETVKKLATRQRELSKTEKDLETREKVVEAGFVKIEEIKLNL